VPVRHNQRVPWRRFLLFAVLLLVAASLVSAMAPRSERVSNPPSEPLPARSLASEVRASLPADKVVRARVGDVVRLTVSAPVSDTVRLSDLGLEQPVDADLPAEFVFVADRPGRFAVRLHHAAETVGTLRISA
jgi:hypothetical protein